MLATYHSYTTVPAPVHTWLLHRKYHFFSSGKVLIWVLNPLFSVHRFANLSLYDLHLNMHMRTHACISRHSITICMAYTKFCKDVLNSLMGMPPPHPSPSLPFGPYLSLSATKMTLRSNSNEAKIRISWRTLRQVKRHSKSTCSSRESMGRRSSNTCMKRKAVAEATR